MDLTVKLFPKETRPNLENFAYNGKHYFGSSKEELIKNFGEPLAVHESTYKNTHYPEYGDVVSEMVFGGLKVIVYRVNESILKDTEHFIRIDVTKDWQDPVTGLGIGVSREDVQNIFGAPDKSDENMDTYSVNNDDIFPPDVFISYENEKVAKITWQYYID